MGWWLTIHGTLPGLEFVSLAYLLLMIPLYLVVINECCSEAHEAHVEFVWWGGVVWCGVCTVFFVSTRPIDLD